VNSQFEDIFKTSYPTRDKYLARLFGLFSEEVVQNWCACPTAPYENLGRPTLWLSDKRGSTLDFTLHLRDTEEIFIAEMKCWLEFDNYRYLRLVDSVQLQRIVNQKLAGSAFQEFLQLAQNPTIFDVRVGGRPLPNLVSGVILIWGATSDSWRQAVIVDYNFADVLSVETMLDDLHIWMPTRWTERINQLRQWSEELFAFLS
jgi:hypothetical protein